MSSNYYFEIILDKEILCNSLELNDFLLRQLDTILHIGKRSAGWMPLFHKTDYYASVQEIREFYIENEDYLNILDEYGWEMSFEELEEELFLWDGGPAARGNPKSHKDLEGLEVETDREGYEFSSKEFF